MSEPVFSKYHSGLGCMVFDRGAARVSLGVGGATVSRAVTASDLRQHALTCLAAALVLESTEGERAEA